jgi:hypothetical protein
MKGASKQKAVAQHDRVETASYSLGINVNLNSIENLIQAFAYFFFLCSAMIFRECGYIVLWTCKVCTL